MVSFSILNTFMYNVEKWPNIFWYLVVWTLQNLQSTFGHFAALWINVHRAKLFRWSLSKNKTALWKVKKEKVCNILKLFSSVTFMKVSWFPPHKKWSFPLRTSSVNVTKSAVSCGFGHIYWRNPWCKTSFLLQCS